MENQKIDKNKINKIYRTFFTSWNENSNKRNISNTTTKITKNLIPFALQLHKLLINNLIF